MNKLFRNENGLTLIELLATFVITSLIITFIISIHIFIQKQYVSEQQDVHNLTDVKIGMKAITRDIRKANRVDVIGTDTIIITIDHEEVKYQWDSKKTLLRDDSNYILNVTGFFVSEEDGKITIEIQSEEEKAETVIVLRE